MLGAVWERSQWSYGDAENCLAWDQQVLGIPDGIREAVIPVCQLLLTFHCIGAVLIPPSIHARTQPGSCCSHLLEER